MGMNGERREPDPDADFPDDLGGPFWATLWWEPATQRWRYEIYDYESTALVSGLAVDERQAAAFVRAWDEALLSGAAGDGDPSIEVTGDEEEVRVCVEAPVVAVRQAVPGFPGSVEGDDQSTVIEAFVLDTDDFTGRWLTRLPGRWRIVEGQEVLASAERLAHTLAEAVRASRAIKHARTTDASPQEAPEGHAALGEQ